MRFCAISAFVHPNHLLELAPVAEEHGWDTLAISDHVLHPETIESRYPYGEDGSRMWDEKTPWPDVWVATGMMAAITKKLRFFQSVYVLPMRDPFHVAKAIGTVAVMSNYRISLGLGLGWMRDEFELLGRPFEQRGARTDEMIDVMRKLWTGEYVEHHGRFYDFPRLSMSPGMEEDIPVIVGGISDAALRRVARLGDGWAPAYLTIDQVAEKVAQIKRYQEEYDRSGHPLSVYTTCIDATGLDDFRRMEEIGVTDLMAVPWTLYDEGLDWLDPTGSPLPKMIDSLKRFADDIIAKF